MIMAVVNTGAVFPKSELPFLDWRLGRRMAEFWKTEMLLFLRLL